MIGDFSFDLRDVLYYMQPTLHAFIVTRVVKKKSDPKSYEKRKFLVGGWDVSITLPWKNNIILNRFYLFPFLIYFCKIESY